MAVLSVRLTALFQCWEMFFDVVRESATERTAVAALLLPSYLTDDVVL